MLSEQYSLAMSLIERLSARLSLADARLLELSAQLDALAGHESPSKPASTEP
jgi:Tfp pilus assembly protein PilF